MDGRRASGVLLHRLKTVRAVEMLLDAAGAAAFGLAVWLALGGPVLGVAIGVLLAAVFLTRATVQDAARRLEKSDPALDGAVTAFAEGGGGRLREPLAEWVLERGPRASHRRSAWIMASATAAIGVAMWARSLPREAAAGSVLARQAPAPAATPALRVSVDVVPPSYTQRPATHIDGPSGPIAALKGSVATLTFQSAAPSVEVTEEGGPSQAIGVTAGQARLSLTLEKPTALRIGTDLVVVFAVAADLPPEVELTLPREDHTVTRKPAAFSVEAVARDDIGLTSLAVLYTLAHGHGEGMKFKSGRIEGKASGSSARMSAQIDPSALGLGPGDTLVIWAEALDGNALDGPGRSASSARILRWDEELAPVELKSSAPALRPMNGPLSQREILARTIRLIAERLPQGRLREGSLDLAEEQARLRGAYGFFLRAEEGNAVELDVDEKELGEPGSDRARRLLADAVSEMWSSEGELKTGNPQGSVPHQRRAVKLLDEAFGNERYALRALAAPKAPVDEGRRLKGESRGLAPRTVPEPVEVTPHAARLRSLARRLLLASEQPTPAAARPLADELWSLPEMANLSRATLAAPLYAARTPEDTARAERSAADALLRYLEPNPVARPAVSSGEKRFFTRLGGEAKLPPREGRKEPAR